MLALPAAALLGPPKLAAPEHAAEQASAEAAPAAEDPLDDFDLEDDAWLDEPPDHLECGNRAVFVVNDQLYRFVFDPLADVWEFVIPKPVRSSLQRFFANLREPANFVNKLAQLRGLQARDTGARFLLNSTVGIGGLFDPAKRLGFEPHNTDFGQTLALYGVGDGAYLVLPVVGPANLRDAVGQLVDGAMRPDVWLLAPGTQLVFVTSDGLAGYEARRVHLDELRKSSLDFYAAMRSAYRMDRAARIDELLAERAPSEPVLENGPGTDPGVGPEATPQEGVEDNSF